MLELFQNFGVIGTVIGIFLTVAIGYAVIKKIFDSKVLLLILILLVILFAKNPGFFEKLPVPGAIGTVTDIVGRSVRDQRNYESCLAGYLNDELKRPDDNPRLYAAYKHCEVDTAQAFTECIKEVQTDHAILDKNSHCSHVTNRDVWTRCTESAIENNSRNGSIPVMNCSRNLTVDTLKSGAGTIAGRDDNQTSGGPGKEGPGAIQKLWESFVGKVKKLIE